MNDIVIVGAGGFAKEVKFLIKEINSKNKIWNFLGYIANDNTLAEVIGNDEWLLKTERKIYCVIAVGSPKLLKSLYLKFRENKNICFPNLIHPSVIMDRDNVIMDEGNIICAGNIFTSDIQIGAFNIFNLSCTIGHDTIFGSFNVINPQVVISGGVKLKSNIMLGTAAIVLQYLKIDSNITVGAGALINKDLLEVGVYVGVPAKRINNINP